MHLGRTDRTFVPHTQVSVQNSPVLLPNFQMAPRLKILMSSGSKKGIQIYYPFLSKVSASESPPGSPTGPLWREMPVSRAFLNISSGFSSNGALPRGPAHLASSESPLHPSLKVPGRRALLQVPQRGLYGKRCPSPEPFPPILQGPQQGSSPSGFPSQSSIERERERERETPNLQSPFQPFLKVPSRQAHSRLPNCAPMKRDALLQSLPFVTQGSQ